MNFKPFHLPHWNVEEGMLGEANNNSLTTIDSTKAVTQMSAPFSHLQQRRRFHRAGF
jgi:hypothetical protein